MLSLVGLNTFVKDGKAVVTVPDGGAVIVFSTWNGEVIARFLTDIAHCPLEIRQKDEKRQGHLKDSSRIRVRANSSCSTISAK